MDLRLTFVSICVAGAASAWHARAQTTVFGEQFDGTAPPAAPLGWMFDVGWETSSSAPSNGSGANNLMHRGSVAGAAHTPAFDLTGAAFAEVSYVARRTASYDPANLQVLASLDGGASFSVVVLAPGSAVPTSASSYAGISTVLPAALLGAPRVVLRFEGMGRSSSSSNVRIDDVAVTVFAERPGAGAGTLGFSTSSTLLPAGAGSIRVPVRLSLDAQESMQGLQFRITWTGDSVHVSGLGPGTAVASADDWTLTHEAGPGHADVLLLGRGDASLPSGTYDPLLSIDLSVHKSDAPFGAVLYLDDVVSALASPLGSDAGILHDGVRHLISEPPGTAVFAASSLQVDLGEVGVGETISSTVHVSNPGGSADLIVTDVGSSSAVFGAAPQASVIAPDSSRAFTITFSPTFTEFGRRRAELVFVHNAAGDSTSISVTGKGRGGRGDAEGDGTVDVMDVVHAIDFALARPSPGPAQTAAADLFPFPGGDGMLDVRDLTVLSQAIVKGRWPDEVPLPPEEDGAGQLGAGAAHLLFSRPDSDVAVVELTHDVPVRAFQITLPIESDEPVPVRTDDESTYTLISGQTPDALRLVAFRPDGGSIQPGTRRIIFSGRVDPPERATAIGVDRKRISMLDPVDTAQETTTEPLPLLAAPYPNPFRVGLDFLRLDVADPQADVIIFDVLGREVRRLNGNIRRWDGRTASGAYAAPGLYVIYVHSKQGMAAAVAVAAR